MTNAEANFSCPYPIQDYPNVLLAHGGGGRLMHGLIQNLFLASFGASVGAAHDAAVIEAKGGRFAFTTDSYVVQPLFFPGGDIGTLAVYGTVNDLAMAGARPLYLSAAFIIEEGLSMDVLARIVASMQAAATRAGVRVITGDTKVVDCGKGDGVFITTAGIGSVEPGIDIRPGRVCPGDVVLVNGDLGRHGIAVMALREGLEFETTISSDSAPMAELVQSLISAGVDVHCLRDVTRGGLTSCLNEIAEGSGTTIVIQENQIPISPDVQAACEVLGLDPLQIACEGRLCAFIPEAQADLALTTMRNHPEGVFACRMGRVSERRTAPVVVETRLGPTRVLDTPSGEQLPRIC